MLYKCKLHAWMPFLAFCLFAYESARLPSCLPLWVTKVITQFCQVVEIISHIINFTLSDYFTPLWKFYWNREEKKMDDRPSAERGIHKRWPRKVKLPNKTQMSDIALMMRRKLRSHRFNFLLPLLHLADQEVEAMIVWNFFAESL